MLYSPKFTTFLSHYYIFTLEVSDVFFLTLSGPNTLFYFGI